MANSTNKDHLIKWRNELKQQQRLVERRLDEMSKRSEEMELLGLETRPRHGDGIPKVGVWVHNGIKRDNNDTPQNNLRPAVGIRREHGNEEKIHVSIGEIRDKVHDQVVRGIVPASGGIAGVGDEKRRTGTGYVGNGSNGAGSGDRISSDIGGSEISNRTF